MDANATTVSSGEVCEAKRRREGRGGGHISLFSKQGACDRAHGVIDEWGGNLREI